MGDRFSPFFPPLSLFSLRNRIFSFEYGKRFKRRFKERGDYGSVFFSLFPRLFKKKLKEKPSKNNMKVQNHHQKQVQVGYGKRESSLHFGLISPDFPRKRPNKGEKKYTGTALCKNPPFVGFETCHSPPLPPLSLLVLRTFL